MGDEAVAATLDRVGPKAAVSWRAAKDDTDDRFDDDGISKSTKRLGTGGTTSRANPEPRSQAGHEWIYVLSGHIQFILAGQDQDQDQDQEPGPGEVVAFDTTTPHWFGSTGDEPAEILSIYGRPGERYDCPHCWCCSASKMRRARSAQRYLRSGLLRCPVGAHA